MVAISSSLAENVAQSFYLAGSDILNLRQRCPTRGP